MLAFTFFVMFIIGGCIGTIIGYLISNNYIEKRLLSEISTGILRIRNTLYKVEKLQK